MLLDSFAHAEEDVGAPPAGRAAGGGGAHPDGHAGGDGRQSPICWPTATRRPSNAPSRCWRRPSAGSEAAAIKRAIEALDHASKPFAERRMNRAMEQGLRGRGVNEVEGKLRHDEHGGHGGHRHPEGTR